MLCHESERQSCGVARARGSGRWGRCRFRRRAEESAFRWYSGGSDHFLRRRQDRGRIGESARRRNYADQRRVVSRDGGAEHNRRGPEKTAEIAIRINPNVDAKTHEKIATGRKQDKFGIDIDQAVEAYRRAAELPGIEAVSVAVHIGSQLVSLDPFRAAFSRVAGFVGELRDAGHDIRRVDLGGGLGIDYDGTPPPTPAAYAQVVRRPSVAWDVAFCLSPAVILLAMPVFWYRG